MSLRIVLALAVISGITGDSNVTTTPQTDAANGAAHADSVLESAEKRLLSGEVGTTGVSCSLAGRQTQIQTDIIREKECEIWIYVLVAIINSFMNHYGSVQRTKALANVSFPHRLQQQDDNL